MGTFERFDLILESVLDYLEDYLNLDTDHPNVEAEAECIADYIFSKQLRGIDFTVMDIHTVGYMIGETWR